MNRRCENDVIDTIFDIYEYKEANKQNSSKKDNTESVEKKIVVEPIKLTMLICAHHLEKEKWSKIFCRHSPQNLIQNFYIFQLKGGMQCCTQYF